MEIVINNKYGGFGLSPKAVKRIAELQGKPCYFFIQKIEDMREGIYTPASLEEATDAFMFYAFTIPNPNEYLRDEKDWHEMTMDERQASNARYDSVKLADDYRSGDRSNPILLQVVKELGAEANGQCAELKIVEIPDGTEYTIEEYDGNEWVAEVHRTWS